MILKREDWVVINDDLHDLADHITIGLANNAQGSSDNVNIALSVEMACVIEKIAAVNHIALQHDKPNSVDRAFSYLENSK